MSWQEKCIEIIELLESYFPEVKYRVAFRKDKVDGWVYIVESIRNDHGSHSGSSISWLQVTAENVESLPEKMLDKAKLRIAEWQKEGLDKVRFQLAELEKVRNELERRLAVNNLTERLEKRIATTVNSL